MQEHFAQAKAARDAGMHPGGVDFYDDHKYEEDVGMGGLYIAR